MIQLFTRSALFALMLVPVMVLASPVARVGDTVSISAVEVVEGDWYAAGGTITASGPVKGDAYLAGGTVTLNAPVTQDVVVAGGTVRIQTDVGDDVRIAAGDTTIAGKVGGDLIVLGGDIHLLSTAVVTGDVLVYGGKLTIDGAVRGSVFGAAGDVAINGRVDGATTFTHVMTLVLGPTANLKGVLTYTSANELTQDAGARMAVEPVYTKTVIPGVDTWAIFESILMFGVLACVFHIVFHKHLGNFVSRARMRWGMTTLVGAGMMLATPLLAIISMVTGIGLFVGIALLTLYVLLLIMSAAFLSVLLGAYAARLYTRTLQATVFTTALGVVCTAVLILAVPAAIIPFLLMLPLGALTLEMYSALFGKVKGRA